MFDTLLPEKSILPAHPWANMAGLHNKKRFYICSEVIDSRQKHNQIGIVCFTFGKIKKFLKSLIFGVDCLFDISDI